MLCFDRANDCTMPTLQASFPDPKNAEAWNNQPMWPAALGSLKNLSYDQQYKALVDVMKALGIDTKKVTHTWRVAGAQAMDAAGVDDAVSSCCSLTVNLQFLQKLHCASAYAQAEVQDACIVLICWQCTEHRQAQLASKTTHCDYMHVSVNAAASTTLRVE